MSRPGDEEPEVGDYLGDLTSELNDGESIVCFCSAGPKNYAFQTNKGKEVVKIRGFTLNRVNSQKLTFDVMKQMIFSKGDPINIVNDHKITRHPLTHRIYNRVEVKKYGVNYTKRMVMDNLDTLPYGWVFEDSNMD